MVSSPVRPTVEARLRPDSRPFLLNLGYPSAEKVLMYPGTYSDGIKDVDQVDIFSRLNYHHSCYWFISIAAEIIQEPVLGKRLNAKVFRTNRNHTLVFSDCHPLGQTSEWTRWVGLERSEILFLSSFF